MDSGILLESGTNELEVLEFEVSGNHYGINVAKIREILPYQNPTPVPNAHPSVEGIYMPRDKIITIINLAKSLGLSSSGNYEKDMYIVTNFNNLQVGFHVNRVIGIHRVSWSDISKPDATLNQAGNSVATGIIKLNDRLVIILDFEKIVTDISPDTGLKMSDVDHLSKRKDNQMPILIVEDSALLSKLIYDCLSKAGYKNLKTAADGLDAWNMLTAFKKEKKIKENVACVITDIEMPQMDGHRLIKLIKSDNELSSIPVVIFSSIVNDEMRKKGELVGADVQLSKPEIGSLVNAIDLLLLK